jgi:hypothetical protein
MVHSSRLFVSKRCVAYLTASFRCLVQCPSAFCSLIQWQGMLAMRRDATTVNHEDFVEGVAQVQAKKKGNLQYYL